ncbi:hypothetical protein [Stackebrandtia soli]|uniref:hypothetical protein n=1 Tax=Stackebrandtia soli TaxID=1892856 RepID=UPI0039EC85E4
MTSPLDVLEALCHRYAFGDVRALVPMLGLPADAVARLRRICLFGQRLVDMDAEDFDMADTADGGPEYTALVDRARACRMPQRPDERYRGALGSLAPSFRLMLEVLAARHFRHDMAGFVSTVHIMGEYLPLLIWEGAWGHAGDPARIGADVARPDSRFGTGDDECAHHRPDASAASRALRIARSDVRGWQTYLDRYHSNLSHAVAVCAGACVNPCSVMVDLDQPTRAHVSEANALALAFGDSSLIKLRHSAPVGHGFGVPSPEEVEKTWQHTREVLAKRSPMGESALTDDGYCLPGLVSFLSTLTNVALTPDTLLRDTAALTVDKLYAAWDR